jgi:hypothetical protein
MGYDGRIQMNPVTEVRNASLAKEELQDLLNYLNGLPEDIRHGGAFAAYEERVGELSREVIMGEMVLLAPRFPAQFAEALRAGAADYGRMNKGISALARQYQHTVEQKQRVDRAVHWGVLAASAASVISAVSITALVIPFSGVAVSLAAAYVAWFSKRSRDQERLAAHLASISEVLDRSFGPSGEVLKPSEYYPASAKRIESLLEEIKTAR